jgi:hypothetical protein
MKQGLLMVGALLFLIGAQPSDPAEELPDTLVPGVHYPDPDSVGDDFAWTKDTPVAFLRHLRGKETYTVARPHRDWVKPEHLADLFALLGSADRCASVHGTWSSVLIPGTSTIGNEAAFIIEGFQKGVYPPWPHSLQFPYDEPRKTELRNWWSEYQHQAK